MSKLQIAGFDYVQACKLAKKSGVMPIEKPDEALIKVFDSLADQCLTKVSFTADDWSLNGFFLYNSEEQEDLYNKMSLGLTCPDESNGSCVVGLSTMLFDRGTPEFFRVVLLHELAHRCGEMEHNETFQIRLNDVMEDFYNCDDYQVHSSRADSAGARIRPKSWRI